MTQQWQQKIKLFQKARDAVSKIIIDDEDGK